MDRRWKHAIESLLRDFLPRELGPAKSKAPVQGGAGEAYRNLPQLDEPAICYDHEDGLADMISVSPTTGLTRLYNLDLTAWETNTRLAPQFADLFTSMYERLPGKYTGRMRAVVQVLAGTPDRIPYDHRWSLTHLVYETTGDPWLIEISAAGVRAKLLPTCTPVDGSGNEITIDSILDKLGWYPAVPPNNWWTATDWLDLIAEDDADLQAFYACASLFDACGWAANTDGSEIRNTCIGSEEDGVGGGSYWRFDEYAITITDDGSGNPQSAGIAKTDTGIAYGQHAVRLKYPEESRLAGTWLVNFDFSGGNIAPPYMLTLTDCTVYTFWNGAQWVKARYQAPKADVISNYDTRPPGFICPAPSEPGGSYTYREGQSTTTYPAICTVNLDPVPGNLGWGDNRWHGAADSVGELGIEDDAGDFVRKYDEGYLGYAFQYVSGGYEVNEPVVLIPCCDREAIYQYKKTTESETRSGTTACRQSRYGGAGHYWQATEVIGPCPQCENSTTYSYPGTEHAGDPDVIDYANKQGASGTMIHLSTDCNGTPRQYYCIDIHLEPNPSTENDGDYETINRSCALYAAGPVTLVADEADAWLDYCESGLSCGQYLHAIPDGLNPGRILASRRLQPTDSDPETRAEQETDAYPTDEISAARAKAWIGDPGDLIGP